MEVDQFAQTRQPDDLFDDDFTPIPAPIDQPILQQRTPHQRPQQPRNPHEHSIRGRGKGHNNRPNDRPQPTQVQQTESPSTTEAQSSTDPEKLKPSTPAARGNRLPTGGIQKPKLTEHELSARLEAVKLNNARREEAHRLAEADEASFQQREAQAREKRREEGAARKAMEGEREKNRLRKLGARGGREWDEGKKEEDFVDGRGGGFRRGMHGGVSGDQGKRTDGEPFVSMREGEEEGRQGFRDSARGGGFEGRRGRGRGRGRGGRGGGRGDYRGDGGGNTSARNGNQNHPAHFAKEEFPVLSKGALPNTPQEKISTLKNADILKSPVGGKSSWADQVEASAPKDTSADAVT